MRQGGYLNLYSGRLSLIESVKANSLEASAVRDIQNAPVVVGPWIG